MALTRGTVTLWLMWGWGVALLPTELCANTGSDFLRLISVLIVYGKAALHWPGLLPDPPPSRALPSTAQPHVVAPPDQKPCFSASVALHEVQQCPLPSLEPPRTRMVGLDQGAIVSQNQTFPSPWRTTVS